MAESYDKRARERRKAQKRREKAERKRQKGTEEEPQDEGPQPEITAADFIFGDGEETGEEETLKPKPSE